MVTLPSSFTSFFIIRVFLFRTMENELSIHQQQAGSLNMGESLKSVPLVPAILELR
jgi:hypothetical protein